MELYLHAEEDVLMLYASAINHSQMHLHHICMTHHISRLDFAHLAFVSKNLDQSTNHKPVRKSKVVGDPAKLLKFSY
jgi:hypothetical protein